MSICGIEPVEDAFLDVSSIVAVGVFEEEDIRSHCDQHSAVPEFETRRIVQTISERDATIGHTVIVVVREDQQLVVHRLQRIPVRICRPRGNPQTSIGINGTLHGIDKVREHFFGGKDIDLHPPMNRHLVDGFRRSEKLMAAVFELPRLVGFDFERLGKFFESAVHDNTR